MKVCNIQQIEGINSWVRSEMRYFGQRANQIALKISGEEPLKKIHFSTIAGFIRFISPKNKYKKDSNRWRRTLVSWWSEYLETEEATKLEIIRKKTTLQRTENWIEIAVNRSLAKLMLAWTEAYGEKTAWNILQKHLELGEEKLTDRDKAKVQQYVREQQSQNIWGIDYKKWFIELVVVLEDFEENAHILNVTFLFTFNVFGMYLTSGDRSTQGCIHMQIESPLLF